MIASELSSPAPPYAGLLRRAVGIALDVAIAWVAYSIAITLLDPNVASDHATTGETVLAAVIVLAIAALWLGYFVVAQWRWGRTLGMRAMGIRLAGRLSLGRALLRTALLVVDCLAGPFLIALSKRRQRLGDRMANTVVLVERDDAAEMPTAAGALDAGEPATVPGAAGEPPPSPEGEPPATERNVAATWGPGRVGVGFLVLLVLSLIEVAVVSIFDPGLDSLGATLTAQALLAATLIGVAFWVAGDRVLSGSTPREALGLRRPLRSPVAAAAAACVAYLVFAMVYSALVHPHQRDITRDLGVGHGDLGTVVAGLLIVAAAPVSEEIFFRGFMFGGFRRRMPFAVAAVLAGAIFGLFHYTGGGSLTVLPQLAFLGLVLCWVYEKSGSIYPTIALHMLNNAFAFAYIVST